MNINQLEAKAKALRLDTFDMIMKAGSGHIGGSFSAMDIIVALYYSKMNLEGEARDRFVLSKGHAAPALYAVLADKGYVPSEEKGRLRRLGSQFQGHPDSAKCPAIDCTTGSLGQGVSVATGMALGLKRSGSSAHVYALSGDGELQEGICWEAMLSAAAFKLDNLTIIVDRNRFQLSAGTEEVVPLGDLVAKFEDFGFSVTECDGNDISALLEALEKGEKAKPSAIIADTVKGKGVSFMENKATWHGALPKGDEVRQAYEELGGSYV